MSAHYYTEVVFPSNAEKAKEILIVMQKRLNWYKAKHPEKEELNKEKQAQLTFLFEFIGIAKETYQVLHSENQKTRKEGIIQGKELAKRELQHQELYGNLKSYLKKDKERIRELSILHAQEKFNF